MANAAARTTTVAAVIPHWNRQELLDILLSNLAQQTRAFDQIIVVDNGSTDDSVAVAESHGATVIQLKQNFGFAVAVNQGWRGAATEWVAILNNDVKLDADWLEVLLASAETASAAFATGKILSARDRTRIDATYDEISRGACALRCGSGARDGMFFAKAKPIRIAPMTAALFRRDLLERMNGLDPQFGSYLEDVDFGLRCSLAGFSGLYEPAAVANHLGSATRGEWNKDTVFQISRNQMLLAAKHFRGQSRWPIVAGQLLWGLVALRNFRLWAYLRGKLAGWSAARNLKTGPEPNRVAVSRLLEQSEKEIIAVQQHTGFDLYWRAYFWLSRPSS
jgi:GT2 family glycosyltransferase